MNSRFTISLLFPLLVFSCGGGFERFVPPSNSISGRGAKVPPHIIATTPTDGATVAPIPGSTGTQIKVVFDMTMQTGGTPIINTYFRDLDSNGAIVWLSAANSGATFSWSSTNVGDDTLTIQLGWVRWPENNVIGFDFNNNSLVNLDSIPLENSQKFSFTVQWETGKYKTVHTGQHQCYYVGNGLSAAPDSYIERINCQNGTASELVGSYNYPAGQNGTVDPRNSFYGSLLYGPSAGTIQSGSRFNRDGHPQNINLFAATNCTSKSTDQCYPFSVDGVTTLIWKTCSEGQYYGDISAVGTGQQCGPGAPFDYTYGNAINACSGLNSANNGQGYGGRKDWRLPTAQELENLVDYGARILAGEEDAFEMPAIHGYQLDAGNVVREGAFPDTPTTRGFWTATGASATFNSITSYLNAFVVEFKKGGISQVGAAGSLLESARATTNRKKVRCVAGPTVLPSPPSYTVSTFQASTQAPTTTSATFTGISSGSFNVLSALPSQDLSGTVVKHVLTIAFNQAPNTVTAPVSSQATNSTNYCIAAATATSCAVSSPLVSTALVNTANANAIDLTLASAPTAGTAYKVFVTNVVSAVGLNPLTTNRVLFTGYPSPTFDVLRADSANSTQVTVVFNRLPTISEATNISNYCIADAAANPYNCATPIATISAASLSGYTVTLTTSALLSTQSHAVFVSGITYLGAQVVTDNNNKLLWKRCRLGTYDNNTCADDGITTNDMMQWNDGLNNCSNLNGQNYAGFSTGWRAPTINELKSIGDRSLFMKVGYSIDTSIFPTPNVLAENFGSSTNVIYNGVQTAGSTNPSPPSNKLFWTFNYISGTPSFGEKDKASTIPGLKPFKTSYRCVRFLP